MAVNYSKRKHDLLSSTASYHSEYKKLCQKPVVSQEIFERMVNKFYNTLKDEAKTIGITSTNRNCNLSESTASFHSEYKEICYRPTVTPLTPDEYELTVTKFYNSMKQEDERKQWEQTLAWAQQTANSTSQVASDSDAASSSSVPAIADLLG
jgi:hypothetical protein